MIRTFGRIDQQEIFLSRVEVSPSHTSQHRTLTLLLSRSRSHSLGLRSRGDRSNAWEQTANCKVEENRNQRKGIRLLQYTEKSSRSRRDWKDIQGPGRREGKKSVLQSGSYRKKEQRLVNSLVPVLKGFSRGEAHLVRNCPSSLS